jgi:hypothetical protein
MTRAEQIQEAGEAHLKEVLANNPDGFHVSDYCNSDALSGSFVMGAEWADANPISHANIALIDYMGRVESLKRDNVVLVEALEFYAKKSEHSPLGGDTARAALAKLKLHVETAK